MRNRGLSVLPLVLVGGIVLACDDPPPSAPVSPAHVVAARAPSTNASATFRLPLPGTAFSVRGDGLFSDALETKYTNGICGVTAQIFAPNPTQDAVMQTDNPSATDRKCAAYSRTTWPRTVSVDYGDGIESNPVTLNVHDLGTVTGTSLRFLGIGLRGASRCDKLQFGGPEGGHMVWVTKTSATSWHVYSQAAPNNTASCVTGGGNTLYSDMNVDLVVTTP